MGVILGVLVLILFVSGVGALAKSTNRPVRSGGTSRAGPGGGGRKARKAAGRSTGGKASTARHGKTTSSGSWARSRTAKRSGRSSWILKAWNASGAPKTSEKTIGGAAAVVTGKAAGAGVRGGKAATKAAASTAVRAGGWSWRRIWAAIDAWLDSWTERLQSAAKLAESTPGHSNDGDTAKEGAADDRKPETVPDTTTTSPATGGTSMSWGGTAIEPSLAAHVQLVAEFEPEDDGDYIKFLASEAAGMVAYAEAAEQLFENCLNSIGLDPAAVDPVQTYAEGFAEMAEKAKEAHAKFMAIYDAVIETVAGGTKLPHDGRWMTGESAA